MWKKLASMIAGSILVSSCQTSMYKPIVCKPGTALREGKCQKVRQAVTSPEVVKPKKYRSKKPGIGTGTVQPPRVYQNIY
jgi:hypothetical protein